jgi:hypothetical protein
VGSDGLPTAAARRTLGAGSVVEVRGFGRGLDVKLAGRNVSSWRRICHRMAHVDKDAPGCVHRGSYDARQDKTRQQQQRGAESQVGSKRTDGRSGKVVGLSVPFAVWRRDRARGAGNLDGFLT